MENLTTDQLLQELNRRGISTKTIWSLNDVQYAIDTYNNENNTKFSLTDADKMTVLDSALGCEYIWGQIFDSIESNVFNILDYINK